jgi:integrase
MLYRVTCTKLVPCAEDVLDFGVAESKRPEQRKRPKQRFEPSKISIKGVPYWQVVLASKVLPNGKRERPRRTFRSHAEALNFARLKRIEKENRGTAGISLDEKLRGDAIEAQELLAPLGVSIIDAAKEYVARAALITKSETVSRAIQSLLAAKKHDNLRDRYLKDLRARLARFAESFGERKLADITSAEIDNWLRSLLLAPMTRNTFRLRLSVLFAYGRVRGWVTDNPVTAVKKVRTSEPLPAILEPQQVARLLEVASEETLPYWAIGAFAGLRSAELERLAWRDVHFDEKVIEVPALSSKTASRRFVRIRPNLLAWLRPYEKKCRLICPPGLRKRLEADRRAARFTSWPVNSLRHSFASYHLARFRDPKDLALELGHMRPDTLFRFYHQRVKRPAALEYWKIVPSVQGRELSQIQSLAA